MTTSFNRFRTRFPGDGEEEGILVPQTKAMEDFRRLEEQEGLRKLTQAKIHARDREQVYLSTPEGELQNDIMQHPLLAERQQFDGVDIPLSQLPYMNRDAKTKYENAKREQQLELQMRLGHMPKMGTAPKPERR